MFEDWVPFPLERVFLFFANPENLACLMPPSTGTRIENLRLVLPPLLADAPSDPSQVAGVGTEIDTSFCMIPYLPFRMRWLARITEFQWNRHFADIQVQGPFRSWYHRHEMFAETRNGVAGTIVRDRIECELGWGILGEVPARLVLPAQIRSIFQYRQRALPHWLGS